MTTTPPATSDQDAAASCDHAAASPGAQFCGECGATLATGNPDTDPLAADPPSPRVRVSPRRELSPAAKRRRILTGVAVVLVVAAFGGFYWVQGQWYDPEEPVEALIEAMENGDGPALAAMIEDSGMFKTDFVKAAKVSPLLQPGVLDDGYEPPTNFDVTNVEYGGPQDTTQREDRSYATMWISYDLAGERIEQEIMVSREDSGWFRQWRLSSSDLLTTISVDAWHTSHGRWTLAGIEGTDTGDMLALPGVYSVTAEGDDLFTTASITETASIGGGASITAGDFGADPTDTVMDAVNTQIKTWVDDCAAGGPPPDSACAFENDTGSARRVPNSADWTLDGYPEVRLELLEDDNDETGPLAVRTETPGAATTEYKNMVDQKRTVNVDIYAYGHVQLEDGKPVWHPWPCPVDEPACQITN